MLLRIKQALANIPITARVTLWYSFFIIAIVAALVAISAVVADEVFEDVSQKKLAKSVTKIANDMDDFEPYDDGIFFIKYNAKGDVIGGLSPKRFQISLKMNSGAVQLYEEDENRFYYYDIAAKGKDVWVRGVINAEKFFKKEGLFLLALGIFVPVLFLFVLYGGYKTIKNAMKPVATMSKTALEIGSSRDFSKRIDLPTGKDELHALASVFNQMLDSLEKVYQSEKQLTSDVSHELRTPLSVIMAESDYAKNYSQNLDEAKESLEVISRQSRKITSLIDQILELSRLEAGRNLELKRINLSSILQNLATDYEKLADANGLKFSCVVAPDAVILGDELMISRLVDNFLSNALKFASAKIELNLSLTKTHALVSVKDDGVGISKKDSELIWNKFYQVESSRNKSLNTGSGLGLAIATNIAKIHGAKLGVKSEAGAGCEFLAEFELINLKQVKI
ncbi:HAMP domain-containing histidine kinase [Campylobacter concisus]|uniref:sensor histidine kinase n=1 Tax=Campylobacter concisus TaxID=199 RepID=UPI0018AB232E|nr:HAMP domain-containing sensor histidine kinase [Campylobacter concisus]QPH99064.1 HAMP domain-containing histidine kinase [Campylobacter concisus]QPI00860.1 HAMP domain-containing histidine kinase [Campylobacter concisus]